MFRVLWAVSQECQTHQRLLVDARDCKGISKLPLIQQPTLWGKISCIRGSLEIPLLSLVDVKPVDLIVNLSRSWLASPRMTSTPGQARWRTASWWPRCSRNISSGITSPSCSTAECRPTPGEWASKQGENWANTSSGILWRASSTSNLENTECNSKVFIHWFRLNWNFPDYILRLMVWYWIEALHVMFIYLIYDEVN